MKNIFEKIFFEKIKNIDLDNAIIVAKGINIFENINITDLLCQKPSKVFLELSASDRKIISYEEFLYLFGFIKEDYQKIYVINNNIFNNFYPLNVDINESIKNLLLEYFDEENIEKVSRIPIENGENYVKIYSNIEKVNDTYFIRYNDEIEIGSENIEIINLFNDSSEVKQIYENIDIAKENIIDVQDTIDYLKVLEKLLTDNDIYLNLNNYIGDEFICNKLQIINDNIKKVHFVNVESLESFDLSNPRVKELLKQYWNYDNFRKLKVYDFEKIKNNEKEVIEVSQERIINDIISQTEKLVENPEYNYRDVFVTAPTGAGKSIMFLIPAMYLAKKYNLVTLVISPLIGLMNDQVENIKKISYEYARTINSDISPIEKEEIINDIRNDKCHILYLSPESLLARSDISQLIGERKIGLVVIDEAHIVTTWGKQFRPDYWYLGDFIKRLRKRQKEEKHSFLMTTFTATAIYGGVEDMYKETLNSLSMHNPITYLGYVKRDNIEIKIEHQEMTTDRIEYEVNKFDKLIEVIKRADLMNKKTLIYFPTVRLIESFYGYCLSKNLQNVITKYHGQMLSEEKTENADLFKTKKKLVMLATKAFGMGIDISDIKIVCHFAPTGNVCDYVQEIGRAARDVNDTGEALYSYMENDFKHINRLHGLSVIKEYQLIKVIEKIYELFLIKLQTDKENNKDISFSKKRNEMLVDAENFAYIFDGPVETDENEMIAKAKTALLLIQKDYTAKMGYSPFTVRPTTLFAKGYFYISNEIIENLKKYYGENTFKLCCDEKNVYIVNLENIWKKQYEKKISFPKFKYLLYTKSDELSYLGLNKISPAICVKLKHSADNNGSIIFNAITRILTKSADNEQYLEIEYNKDIKKDKGVANYIKNETAITPFRANSIANILISVIENYNRNFSKTMNAALYNKKYFENNVVKYKFNRPIYDFIDWISKIKRYIKENENDNTLYLISNENDTKLKEVIIVLGLLESLGCLHFEANGGLNSQIYIHVNQTKTLQEVVNRPYFYKNGLLEKIKERHRISVAMLSFLYKNNFKSDEIWEYIENYFLGQLPESIKM